MIARVIARVLVPASMLAVLLGMALAARVYHATHPFHSNTVVLSDYENHEENPAGFQYAVAGMALGCVLLLPAAFLFFRAGASLWNRAAAVLFGGAAVAGVAMALLDFRLDLYNPVHVFLAFSTVL